MNAYIRDHYKDRWVVLHGNDEGEEETGFHLVQNDGAKTYLFSSDNAVNTVADGIYHLGFDIQCNRFLNEDGNASVERVAFWLNELYGDNAWRGRTGNSRVGVVPASRSLNASTRLASGAPLCSESGLPV